MDNELHVITSDEVLNFLDNMRRVMPEQLEHQEPATSRILDQLQERDPTPEPTYVLDLDAANNWRNHLNALMTRHRDMVANAIPTDPTPVAPAQHPYDTFRNTIAAWGREHLMFFPTSTDEELYRDLQRYVDQNLPDTPLDSYQIETAISAVTYELLHERINAQAAPPEQPSLQAPEVQQIMDLDARLRRYAAEYLRVTPSLTTTNLYNLLVADANNFAREGQFPLVDPEAGRILIGQIAEELTRNTQPPEPASTPLAFQPYDADWTFRYYNDHSGIKVRSQHSYNGCRVSHTSTCTEPLAALTSTLESLGSLERFTILGRYAYFKATGGLRVRVNGTATQWHPDAECNGGTEELSISFRKTPTKSRLDLVNEAYQLLQRTQAPDFTDELLLTVAQRFRTQTQEAHWQRYLLLRETEPDRAASFPASAPPTLEAVRSSRLGVSFALGDDGCILIGRRILNVVLETDDGDEYPLGDFDLDLRVMPHGQWEAYAYSAGNDNPSRDGFYHPHVLQNRVCTGDAGPQIATALASGHYCLAMQALEAVLRNYNSESPYRRLESWTGHYCEDCDGTVDELHECNSCSHEACDGCLAYCRWCEDSYCGECSTCCSNCSSVVCNECARRCPCCDDSICPSCWDNA